MAAAALGVVKIPYPLMFHELFGVERQAGCPFQFKLCSFPEDAQ